LSCTAGALPWLLLQLFHSGFKHGSVEFEADGLNVAALLAAEHVACAAQLQI